MWKANIPHTHLAKEKSDQNWMVVKGDKIGFPGGGTHFHYGADKYIASIANVSSLWFDYNSAEPSDALTCSSRLIDQLNINFYLNLGCFIK